MAKILTFEIPEDEYNEFKDFLEKAVVEMRESREKMQKDREETARLREESQKIKAESDALAAENRKILERLEAKWLKAA